MNRREMKDYMINTLLVAKKEYDNHKKCWSCKSKSDKNAYFIFNVLGRRKALCICPDCREKILTYLEQNTEDGVLTVDEIIKHLTKQDSSGKQNVDFEDFGSYYAHAKYKQDHKE